MKIFISYSHVDEKLKDELIKMLSGFKRSGMVEFWNDRDITAGEEWKTKIDSAKEANINFVNAVFDNNESHKVGLVAFNGSILDDWSQELSVESERQNLIDKINLWYDEDGTCLCCGVDKAIDYLKDSDRFKAMIVMADGSTGGVCDSVFGPQAAINSAETAFQNGIKVYTRRNNRSTSAGRRKLNVRK